MQGPAGQQFHDQVVNVILITVSGNCTRNQTEFWIPAVTTNGVYGSLLHSGTALFYKYTTIAVTLSLPPRCKAACRSISAAFWGLPQAVSEKYFQTVAGHRARLIPARVSAHAVGNPEKIRLPECRHNRSGIIYHVSVFVANPLQADVGYSKIRQLIN